jgi:repressor LexA
MPNGQRGVLSPGERRARIVEVINDAMQRNGYPPSQREIAEAAGLASASSVSYHLGKLEQEGLLVRERGRPRTATLHRPSAQETGSGRPGGWADPGALAGAGAGLTHVPWVGRIAAGRPITAAELPGDIVPLPQMLVGQGEHIMLSVAGESMTDAAIMDGDWVVVRRQDSAENGEIVAAMLDSDSTDGSEATVKTYRKRDGHVWLIPHNPAFTPIPGDKAKIIGKVVAVLRRL